MPRDVDIPNIDITEFLQGASSTWGGLEAAPCQLQVMLGAEYTELKTSSLQPQAEGKGPRSFAEKQGVWQWLL